MNFEMKELPRQQSDRVRDVRNRASRRAGFACADPGRPAARPGAGGRGNSGTGRIVARVLDRSRRHACSSSSARAACTTSDGRARLRPATQRPWRRSSRATSASRCGVYFEKPRTTTGWKGLINDPHLDDSRDVNYGLHMARSLLLEVVSVRPHAASSTRIGAMSISWSNSIEHNPDALSLGTYFRTDEGALEGAPGSAGRFGRTGRRTQSVLEGEHRGLA